MLYRKPLKNTNFRSNELHIKLFRVHKSISRSVVVVVLHIGNINFAKGKEVDSSVIQDDNSRFHLNTASELLE